MLRGNRGWRDELVSQRTLGKHGPTRIQEEARKDSPQSLRGDIDLMPDTLISDFWPPEL
jgi:hypothetical protein